MVDLDLLHVPVVGIVDRKDQSSRRNLVGTRTCTCTCTGYAKMFFHHPTQNPTQMGGPVFWGTGISLMYVSKCYIVRTPSDVLVFLLQSILFFEPQQQPTATERPTHCSVATKEPWRALVPSASIRHSRRATFGLAFLVVAAYRVWRPGHSCA